MILWGSAGRFGGSFWTREDGGLLTDVRKNVCTDFQKDVRADVRTDKRTSMRISVWTSVRTRPFPPAPQDPPTIIPGVDEILLGVDEILLGVDESS